MDQKVKNQKEILSNLLKQLLDHRLLKLEIKNDDEIKKLKLVSQDSKNIIIALEEYSHNVRKEIYLQRHKKYDYQKDSRRPSKIKSNKIDKIAVPKRDSQKEFISQNKVKENMHNMSRNSHSKNKNNRYKDYSVTNSNTCRDNLSIQSDSKFINKKHVSTSKFGLSQCNSKSRLGKLSKNSSKKINLGLNFPYSTRRSITPRNKQKNIPHPKKDSISNFDVFSVTTKQNSKNIFSKRYNNYENQEKTPKKSKRCETELDFVSPNKIEDDRLNKLNIFGNSQKPEEKNKSKIINNTTGKKSFLDNLTEQISKVDTIKLDDNLLNDELLVKGIKGSMIKMDDRVLNDELLINVSNNKDVNLTNDSLVKNKAKESDKKTNKSNLQGSRLLIANLDNDDMNYILAKDDKIEDIEINNSLTLQELFETNLDVISRYLNNKDICNVMLVNRECFKSLMNILISKTEISIDILEDEIKKIKTKNTNIDFSKIQIKPFKFSQNSMRVVPLLNACGLNITKISLEQINTYKVAVIYYLYFIASGHKNDFVQFIDNGSKMLEFLKKYFSENLKNNKMGEFIEKTLNGKVFDDDTISSLYTYAHQYSGIISPNHYQIISKDIAIFVFIIRDILEFIGITGNTSILPEKEFILLNARLNNKRSLLDHLNKVDNDFG